jgi:GYF domain 2
MNWFYAKDGQQIGPVEFSEIERLRSEGQLTDDTLVWQQGMTNWVKLSSLSKTSAGIPEAPTLTPAPPQPVSGGSQPVPSGSQPVASGSSPLPDYGDFLCWGIFGILLPCAGLAVYIALIVLHVLEFSAVRKAIAEGRLKDSDYSKIHPALFILGLVCCGGICYPLFMHFRNRAGYFKPQPYAVWVAIIAVVLSIGINVALNIGTTALQQPTQ